jgi:mannose-1-phosphate guanylyltransferase / mannose-6-phosphate isomerase
MNTISVIICGGTGTRLCAVSRETSLKPLLKLADGQIVEQKTGHTAGVAAISKLMVVTNRDTFFLTEDECDEVAMEVARVNSVPESVARNAAATIGVAAAVVREWGGRDVDILAMPEAPDWQTCEGFI